MENPRHSPADPRAAPPQSPAADAAVPENQVRRKEPPWIVGRASPGLVARPEMSAPSREQASPGAATAPAKPPPGESLLPREKMLALGAGSLSDAELLAIFLGTGVKGMPVLELAQELLQQFGGLRGLMEADQTAVESLRGVGTAKFCHIAATLELARRYLRHGLDKGEAFNSPDITRQFLQFKLRHQTREVFACLFLDNQNRLIAYEELFYGTIDGASVHPREVVRRALELNAAAVLLAHNHPSGVAEPSESDRRITSRLQAALKLMDVRVLDHMVVGDTDVVSFAERGLLLPPKSPEACD